MLLLATFHTTTAFVATTSNRFCSRAAAGAGGATAVGVRGAETKIAAATGFFETLFGGMKVNTQSVFGVRHLFITFPLASCFPLGRSKQQTPEKLSREVGGEFLISSVSAEAPAVMERAGETAFPVGQWCLPPCIFYGASSG